MRVDSNSTLTVDYQYDNNGNRKRQTDNQSPVLATTYEYDPENRLIRAQDHQGQNGSGQLNTPHEVTLLCRDGEGRVLVKLYDENANNSTFQSPECDTWSAHAMESNVRTMQYLLSGLDPLVEYSLQGSGTLANPNQRTDLVRGAGMELLARQEYPSGSANQFLRYHPDGRGNIASLTKEDGQSHHNYRYDAFGRLLPVTGNFLEPHNHYAFGGKQWDEHSELYEFGAREYDASVGQWLTPDVYRGEISRPLSLHRTAYVHQSPISYRDEYGYWLTDEWTWDEGFPGYTGGSTYTYVGADSGNDSGSSTYEANYNTSESGGSQSSGSDASSSAMSSQESVLNQALGLVSDVWHGEGVFGGPQGRDVQRLRGSIDRAIPLIQDTYEAAELVHLSRPERALTDPVGYTQQWTQNLATFGSVLVSAEDLYYRNRPERAWTDPVGFYQEQVQNWQWVQEKWQQLDAAYAENPGRVEGAIMFEAGLALLPFDDVGRLGQARGLFGRVAAADRALPDEVVTAATYVDDPARVSSSLSGVEKFYRAVKTKKASRLLGGDRATANLFGNKENFFSTSREYVANYAQSTRDLVALEFDMPVGTRAHLTHPDIAHIHVSVLPEHLAEHTIYDPGRYLPFIKGTGNRYLQLKMEGEAFNIGLMKVQEMHEWFMRNILDVRRIQQ